MPRQRTRIFLKAPDGTHHPVFWVRNNRPNEMLLGLYGLKEKLPNLKYQWPEEEVGSGELAELRYYFDKKTAIDLPVDHVTCHADGRFHIKTLGSESLYTHVMKRTDALGPDTDIFLEFTIFTDLPERYRTDANKPKVSDISLEARHYQYVYGCFSGANFALERKVDRAFEHYAVTFRKDSVSLGDLKGVLVSGILESDPEAELRRPPGTFLTFKFPVPGERWRIKTFQFE